MSAHGAAAKTTEATQARAKRTKADGANAEIRDPGPIRVWIVLATGFRQSRRRVSGMELLWRKMRWLSSPEVCVITPECWDDDAEAMADYIERNSRGRPAVFFAGYSYGVGSYFMGFAEALQVRGIGIDTAVLCDGVRRFRFAKFLSLAPFRYLFTIWVPGNVETVYAFWQNRDRLLRGHDVVADDPQGTEVEMIQLHGFGHEEIDESLSFHRVAIKEAEDVIHAKLGYDYGREEASHA